MATIGLADRFPCAVEALNDCFGQAFVGARMSRLNQIFRVTESAWNHNLYQFCGRPIQYLLIGEAAPWTQPDQPPRYFYKTLDGAWVGRILKVFFEDLPSSAPATLSTLAERGFLLVDTLPFSLPYTTRIRKKPAYLQLLQASRGYFLTKLQKPRLKWSDNVKVALAFKWNGRRTIEAYTGGIDLPSGLRLSLNEKQIAADKSGYTNTGRLRDIWGLSE